MYSFVMLLESFTGTSGRRKNKFWNYFALESDNRVYSTSKTDSLMRRHNSRWQSFISYLRINIPSRCSYPEILLLWLANWDSCSCCSNAQMHSFHIVNRLLYNVQCVCVCVCLWIWSIFLYRQLWHLNIANMPAMPTNFPCYTEQT